MTVEETAASVQGVCGVRYCFMALDTFVPLLSSMSLCLHIVVTTMRRDKHGAGIVKCLRLEVYTYQ
jgi:hypothetical protein